MTKWPPDCLKNQCYQQHYALF